MTLVLDLLFIPPPPPLEVVRGGQFSWVGFLMLGLALAFLIQFTYIVVNFMLRSSASVEEYMKRTYRPQRQGLILCGLMLVAFAGGWVDNQVQIKLTDEKKATHRAAESEIEEKIEPALEEYYGVDIGPFGLPQTPSDASRIQLRTEGELNEGCFLHVVNNEYRISCGSSDFELATELTPVN